MYRVLSIDGGGVRGLIPALVLAEIEGRARRRIADLFDFVAGTSTGAILALGLLRPDSEGRPRWAAKDLTALYETGGARTFRSTPWRFLRTMDGFLAPKYDAGPLAEQLREKLGATKLSRALREVIITSYDTRSREPFFFKSADMLARNVPDLPMAVVAQASAAAPTYFPPVRIPRQGQRDDDRWLVDGGVFANNPAMCAYAEARRRQPAADIAVVSIGTGELATDLATARMRRAGALLWARPLFDVVLDGQENATDYQLRQLLADNRYHRFQADLDSRSKHIDDGSPENQARLRASANRLISRCSAELDDVVAMLTEDREESRR